MRPSLGSTQLSSTAGASGVMAATMGSATPGARPVRHPAVRGVGGVAVGGQQDFSAGAERGLLSGRRTDRPGKERLLCCVCRLSALEMPDGPGRACTPQAGLRVRLDLHEA